MFHLSGPLEKSPEILSLVPEKLPEFQEANLLHFDAAVRFNSPQEIGATPRSKAMAAAGVPHEAKHVAHRER